jgi:hypothetical protein
MPRRDDWVYHGLGDNSWHNHHIAGQREPAHREARVLGDARSLTVRRLIRIRPYDELRQTTGRDLVPRAPHHKTPVRVEALEHHHDSVGTNIRPTDQQGSELMRKGSTYIALCCLLAACVAAGSIPGTASAARARYPRVASIKQTTSSKLKTIHLKLLGKVAPGLENRAGWLYTDGVRWAAYEQVAGTTRIIDTKTGHTSSRPDPEGCSGGLIAVGGGEILYKCANPECPRQIYLCDITPQSNYATARLVVEDIATGRQVPVAGESQLPSHADDGYGGPSEMEAIGSNWAMGRWYSYRANVVFFVNWHTGVMVSQEEGPVKSDEDVENLNSATLIQSLCPSLKRPRTENPYSSGAYAPVSYESPFALAGTNSANTDAEDVPLQLLRCGSHRHELLPENGGSAQLGGDVLSWFGGEKEGHHSAIYVTRLYPHRTQWHGTLYRVSRLAEHLYPSNALIQHTSTMIFATVSHGSSGGEIYAARLP